MKKQFKIFMTLLLALCFFPRVEAAPVTMHVKDGDIRSVLLTIADLGELDIIIDESVSGKVTIELKDTEPIEAVKLIAAARALTIEERGGIVLVSSAYDTSQGLYSPHVFKLNHAELATVREAVKISLNKAGFFAKNKNYNKDRKTNERRKSSESDEGDTDANRIATDALTNSLILYGTAEEAEFAKKIIASLDVPAKQISLEAKVVAVQKDAAKKLGIEWEWSRAPQYPDYTTTYETVHEIVENPDGSRSSLQRDVPRTTVTRHFNNGTIPGIISFGRSPEGHPFEFYYAATINALVSDGKADILARPNIMTLSGKEAVINIGGEVPVPTISVTNSTTTTSVIYKEAGIILRYTPRVSDDGDIIAEVHTEVSSPLYVDDLKAYRFNKRSADTTVRLKNGETMIIGGLIGSEETRSLSKIPFLGDLPILGAFFRNSRRSKTESEVMIFLTARIIEDK